MTNTSSARPAPSQRVTAVLGPTNTGKTHYAVTRMLAYETGMIGLPLRLLAREIYDRVVEEKGAAKVALITGEEKIAPESATYFICTVESMRAMSQQATGWHSPMPVRTTGCSSCRVQHPSRRTIART